MGHQFFATINDLNIYIDFVLIQLQFVQFILLKDLLHKLCHFEFQSICKVLETSNSSNFYGKCNKVVQYHLLFD